jgi:hypothetical protein
MWYEVYTVTNGALDQEHVTDTCTRACEQVVKYQRELQASDCEDWKIFLLPHYCSAEDEECVCAQYLTDHRPMFSSEELDTSCASS